MSPRIHPGVLAGGMVLAVLLLSGCASNSPGPGSGGDGPAATPDAVPSSEADVSADFTNRPELPSCGAVELDQGETIPQDALDCLAAAGAGTAGAELVVTAPTVEGDPIVSYYRALPDGGIEVFVDMTKDSFGGGWAYDLCADATGIDEAGACIQEAVD